MTTVDRLVPPDAVLATLPARSRPPLLRPRELVAFRTKGASEPPGVLLWEDEWRRLRDASGHGLPVLAVSEARQSRRGSLALVLAPGGELRRVQPPPPAEQAPGLRANALS